MEVFAVLGIFRLCLLKKWKRIIIKAITVLICLWWIPCMYSNILKAKFISHLYIYKFPATPAMQTRLLQLNMWQHLAPQQLSLDVYVQ